MLMYGSNFCLSRGLGDVYKRQVFVTDDGAETDLDLGHYERFIDIDLAKANSSSSGPVSYTHLTLPTKRIV